MVKKKIRKLSKKYYVSNEYGHTDENIVGKVNELIDIVNHQQEVIKNLELILKCRR